MNFSQRRECSTATYGFAPFGRSCRSDKGYAWGSRNQKCESSRPGLHSCEGFLPVQKIHFAFAALLIAAVCSCPLIAQSSDLPRFGLGVSASSLGPGIEAATAVTHNSNLRAGFHFFNYGDSFSKDGVNYTAKLKFRSAQITFDQYIKGSFHISPGVLIYNGNQGSANAAVPAGQAFTLGSTTYYSGQSNPISGVGSVTFNRVSPMVLLGFGNMLPRSQRHFGLNFDAGVVFEGSPKALLSLAGSACLSSAQVACLNAATDPTVQTSVQAEQTKINGSLGPFKYYPVVALTFSYKF
jgi:hypothetical protein